MYNRYNNFLRRQILKDWYWINNKGILDSVMWYDWDQIIERGRNEGSTWLDLIS